MTKIVKSSDRFLITPSLLNAWGYIWESQNNVRESENDTISLEDKQADAMAKAKEDFIKVLNREPTPTNERMQMGIDFEADSYAGKTCVSDIIKGGAFQIVGTKEITVGGMNFLLYCRLDVLKGGTIYDIKRVIRYNLPKYNHSYQHPCYFEVFPRAKEFQYLVVDDNLKLHRETYYPSECEPVEKAIIMLIDWLKQNDLLEVFKLKWKARKN